MNKNIRILDQSMMAKVKQYFHRFNIFHLRAAQRKQNGVKSTTD